MFDFGLHVVMYLSSDPLLTSSRSMADGQCGGVCCVVVSEGFARLKFLFLICFSALQIFILQLIPCCVWMYNLSTTSCCVFTNFCFPLSSSQQQRKRKGLSRLMSERERTGQGHCFACVVFLFASCAWTPVLFSSSSLTHSLPLVPVLSWT
jgi:hypothetical protein